MATIWTRRRGGCVLSATFEDRTTTPSCDFETKKQKHTLFLSEEEVFSLFHSLFFCGERKEPPKNRVSKKAAVLITER